MLSQLEWALRYHSIGWQIMPCEGKRPLMNALEAWDFKWEPLQTQKVTAKIVEWWWKHWPHAQIALICGQISNVTVIDIDTHVDNRKYPDKQPEDVDKIFCEDIGLSVSSITGSGGRHIFCKYAKIKNTAQTVAPQIDTKSDEGYVILPESIHPDHQRAYIWDTLFPFDEENIKNLITVPKWIQIKANLKPKNDWTEIISRTGIGSRNTNIAKLTGKLLCQFDPEEVFRLVMAWNRSLPEPEEEQKAVRTIQSIIQTHQQYDARFRR